MLSLEQEIRQYLRRQSRPFYDFSRGEERFKRLDFALGDAECGRQFHFDAKEKRRHYNLHNWPPTSIPEAELFILDDLAARKILLFAPYAGLLVRDHLHSRYVLFTVVDLFLMPKQRLNRPIQHHRRALKGKWLIDLRNGLNGSTLAEMFAAIERYLDLQEEVFFKELACFGQYEGETIARGGIVRRPWHWQHDVQQTR